ncbi:MAG: hypothetical protein SWN10_05615 [Pseudomonadota bacterium]|nr:hypothetical protein [Pseudomonadota bacterium]
MRKAFSGKALAIARCADSAGEIIIKAKARGLTEARVVISAD